MWDPFFGGFFSFFFWGGGGCVSQSVVSAQTRLLQTSFYFFSIFARKFGTHYTLHSVSQWGGVAVGTALCMYCRQDTRVQGEDNKLYTLLGYIFLKVRMYSRFVS